MRDWVLIDPLEYWKERTGDNAAPGPPPDEPQGFQLDRRVFPPTFRPISTGLSTGRAQTQFFRIPAALLPQWQKDKETGMPIQTTAKMCLRSMDTRGKIFSALVWQCTVCRKNVKEKSQVGIVRNDEKKYVFNACFDCVNKYRFAEQP